MNPILLVVERPESWPLEIPGVDLVAARSYLTDPSFVHRRDFKVFNLCRSYRHQSLGYYVSLLAEARGHRVLPSSMTIQDLKSRSLVRFISDDLDGVLQKSLGKIASNAFVLSIYFGKNLAQRHERLSRELFNLFPAPLLRAQLSRTNGRWQLQGLRPIAFKDIPDEHHGFVVEAAREHFARRRRTAAKTTTARYDLAILVDPTEPTPPSDEKALDRIVQAAHALELRPEIVTRDDYGRLAEFDALFIRATTQVDHYTYRFARRAAADGLVVIDDPVSIVRAANKVFLAEMLSRMKIPTPRTVVVHRENLKKVPAELGLPAVLKLPDGSFSLAVVKLDDRKSFLAKAREYLESSELLIAQEFLPTAYDWRIGVLDGQVLFAAHYLMVKGHWQVAHTDGKGRMSYGGTRAKPLDEVPPAVLDVARRSAAAVGDGLYGVDVKEVDGHAFVIEVNDNPNLDADCEDGVLGDELYRRILGVMLARIERLKEGRNPS